jgi:hypothetical protein
VTARNSRNAFPVPLRVVGLEREGGQIVAVHGLTQTGRPWRLPVDDAIAAVASRRYSLGLGQGSGRVNLQVVQDGATFTLTCFDEDGKDRLLELPEVVPQ